MTSKKPNPELSFSKFAYLFLFFLIISLFAVFTPLVFSGDPDRELAGIMPLDKQESVFERSGDRSNLDPIELASIEKRDCVGRVEEHSVSDPAGQAILVLQKHQHPGSDSGDKINDAARQTQEQILDIVSTLHNKKGVDIIMNEGIVYGQGAQEKMNEVSREIELRNKFASALDKLKGAESSSLGIMDSLAQSGKEFLDRMDRAIILEGAPYVLKAQEKDDDLRLYGAENRETRQKSAQIVRKYVYLQDAQNRNGGSSGILEMLSRKKSAELGQSFSLKSLLEAQSSRGASGMEQELKLARRLCSFLGSKEAEEAIMNLNRVYEKINNFKSGNGDQEEKDLPSRSDNPYLSRSPQELQELMAETERQMEDWVIEQRNVDTAENFLRVIKQSKEDAGIIQFGAGHKEGLIQELKKRNISVTVITPSRVVKANK